MRIFLNGAAIMQDNSPPLAKGKITRTYPVPLLDGYNAISAVAFNADGTVQSNDATAFITAKLPPAKPPVLHAVIVGIQVFKHLDTKYQLTQSVGDAQFFEQTLENFAPSGFGKLDITPLDTSETTDKKHVVDALKAMQPRVRPNDVFIFYFVSHGEVSQGKYYFVTSNVDLYDRLSSEALGSQDFAGLLANISATRNS